MYIFPKAVNLFPKCTCVLAFRSCPEGAETHRERFSGCAQPENLCNLYLPAPVSSGLGV
jgi:hypothetical protein